MMMRSPPMPRGNFGYKMEKFFRVKLFPAYLCRLQSEADHEESQAGQAGSPRFNALSNADHPDDAGSCRWYRFPRHSDLDWRGHKARNHRTFQEHDRDV